MKSTEITGSILIGTLKTHQKKYFVAAEHFKTSTSSPACCDDISIKRDEFGTIDYKYYAKKTRQIRSDSACLFLKALVSYVIVLGSVMLIMI